jgi:hypothetical protein
LSTRLKLPSGIVDLDIDISKHLIAIMKYIPLLNILPVQNLLLLWITAYLTGQTNDLEQPCSV